ncbi:YwbE family protein [Paenibacillus humicola]|uniref:YwbE family protein n=1 Tax=Paenibacillus humicola TaxID=3110540 RepID=UPI00237A5007|nr:YwbE family protein [Paenibacillus humicola]
MDGRVRSQVRPGQTVEIVLKKDQPTGKTTRGVVKDLLTNSPTHPHGIKVRLTSGEVGRVKTIVSGSPE